MYSMAIYSVKLVLYLYFPVNTLILRSIMAFPSTLQTSLLTPKKFKTALKYFLTYKFPLFTRWLL